MRVICRCIKYSICLIKEVTNKATSKANLSIVDKEDVLDYSRTSLLAVLIKEVFILDLDIEIVVF
jgi:hypothetical protein